MVKVLFITYNLGSGGAEKVFQILMNNLDRKKFIVQCVIVNKVLHKAYLNPNIDLHELNFKSSFKAIFKIRSIIKKLKPDLVIGTITPINIILPLVKVLLPKKNRPKFLVRESTVMSNLVSDNSFRSKAIIGVLKQIYPRYHKIICQSNDIRNDMIDKFNVDPSKLHIINNPMESGKFQNSRRAENKNIKFITVGRIRPEKGHVRILEALKNFEKIYGEDYQYHIVGDFSSEEMEKKVYKKVHDLNLENKVVFHGYLDEPGNILKDCDVFLQGSYFEGFPNAVMESCFAGVPVVAYDVPGGTKEIIKHGFNGFLSPDHNISDYVQKMGDAMNTSFNREAMANDIYARFNQEKIVNQYEQLFISLVQEK